MLRNETLKKNHLKSCDSVYLKTFILAEFTSYMDGLLIFFSNKRHFLDVIRG